MVNIEPGILITLVGAPSHTAAFADLLVTEYGFVSSSATLAARELAGTVDPTAASAGDPALLDRCVQVLAGHTDGLHGAREALSRARDETSVVIVDVTASEAQMLVSLGACVIALPADEHEWPGLVHAVVWSNGDLAAVMPSVLAYVMSGDWVEPCPIFSPRHLAAAHL